MQLVHEILQIKEEQEERITIVKTKKEDTHKSKIAEMVEQVFFPIENAKMTSRKGSEKTQKARTVQKNANPTEKRDGRRVLTTQESEAHVEKERRHADKGKITQEEKIVARQ